MKILIAEDDTHIRMGLEKVLQREGYTTIGAANGREALEIYHNQKPDFIILDIMMPELDGYSVCKEIRKTDEQTPIVFLSAKDEEIDRVIGLELGADDYISKPFGIHEIRARIKSIARRCLRNNSSEVHSNDQVSEKMQPFLFGHVWVHPAEMRAVRDEQNIELSVREIKILQCLYQHKNKVVSRDVLFNAAWGYEHMPNSRTLDQHISQLRKSIELDANAPQLIRTVHGAGYRYQES
ncbi:MAG: response regulator transcription factor [Saezia sp.]